MPPTYSVNADAVAHARELIAAGRFDADTPWGDAAPSAADGNEELEEEDWDGYQRWYLAVDPDASAETKKRYAFPYGDFERVNRSALIHAKQRASQNGHDAIEQAADDLLQRLDQQAAR